MCGGNVKVSKADHWDPAVLKPADLFRSPDLTLLCAKHIEGQFYERKSKCDADKLAQTICAFANSNRDHGGLLAVGIADDGSIDGLLNRDDVNVNRLLEYHYYTGTPTERRFVACKNRRGQDDQILLVYVPYLEGRVAETSKGKAYVRQGDKTVELRDADKRELEYSKGQISFEDEIACEYSPDMLVQEIVEELRASVVKVDGASADLSVEQVLTSKHLVKKVAGKVYLTKAGLLLLAKDPKSALPGAYVRFLRYSGTEKKGGAGPQCHKGRDLQRPPAPAGAAFEGLHAVTAEGVHVHGPGRQIRAGARVS